MKFNPVISTAVCILGLSISASRAQFTSGSDGSYGPVTLADSESRTLVMPADGIFKCTTITLGRNSQLFFTKNAANTPVYLLATGDISLLGGTIFVNGNDASGVQPGTGGPGGFDGGHGGIVDAPVPGWGGGPGGGHGGSIAADALNHVGAGSYATRQFEGTTNEQAHDGPAYGSPLLVPLVGGSGGGGTIEGIGGGGGGGAILLASNTSILIAWGPGPGTIDARPGMGSGFSNMGSSGAIRLVAPRVEMTGSGPLYVHQDGIGLTNQGVGRVRIDTLDTSGLLGRTSGILGSLTIGRNMMVFPQSLPKLEVIGAAGQTINPAQSVTLSLPSGAAATQPVIIRATNFGGTARVKVVITPERGEQVSYNLDIPNPGPGTATGTATVQFPGNMVTRIEAWTR